MNGDRRPSAATVGGALATLTWTLLGALTEIGGKLGDAGIAACTGASAIVFGAILWFWIGEPNTPA